MSKKLNSSINKNNSSNTLLNYFAKSPAVEKKNNGVKKHEEQENLHANLVEEVTPRSKRKLNDSPLPLDDKAKNVQPKQLDETPKKHKINNSVDVESDEDDDVPIQILKNKRRRVLQLSDDDSNDEVEKPETKKSKFIEVSESATFLQKLEECKHNSIKTETNDEDLQVLSEKLESHKNEESAVQYKEKEEWPHHKLEFLKKSIKDANGRKPDHPDYDKTTLYVPQKFLDTLSPAVRQWWILKSQHFDCVLFFKVGKFYELYHMDADVGVKELGFTYMRGEFAHAGFPEVSFDKMASILIDRGYKIARVEQTETVDMMTQRCKTIKPTKFDKVVRREICQISNRGTRIFGTQCQIAIGHELNYMMAITEQTISNDTASRFGVAFIDTTIGEFYLGEFDDDSGCSRLLTLLSHHMPVLMLTERGALSSRAQHVFKTMLSDVLKEQISRNDQAFASADKILSYLAEKYYGATEDKNDWPAALKTFHADDGHLIPNAHSNAKLCLKSLGLCIAYLKRQMLEPQVLATARYSLYVPPDDNSKQPVKSSTTGPEFMVLDSTALSNLHIIGKSEKHTLERILDHCCTKFGKRLLHFWLCAPSCNLEVIKCRQQAISTLIKHDELLKSIRSLFATFPDLERILTQLQLFGNKHIKQQEHPDSRAILFEETIYNKKKIKAFISTLKSFDNLAEKLPNFFEKDQLIDAPLLQRLLCLPEDGGMFPNMQKQLKYFHIAFDHEKAANVGFMEPNVGADTEYDKCLDDIENVGLKLKEYLKEQEGYFGCRVQYVGSDKKRFQLEVPEKQSSRAGKQYSLESQRKGFKRYSTDESRELLKEMIAAEERRDNVLRDLSRRIFAKFAEHNDMWKQAIECVANLDVLCSLAYYALSQNIICIPELEPIKVGVQPSLFIEEGYHPLINNENYIPNGIELGTTNAAPLSILTGANMGGKSTLMRQVGLLVIMSQIGAHVPAKSFRSTIVDRIFTRAGARDDILAGLSTFLVELNETSFILQHATANSLVLLDELGRGTGSYDGFAIAASVVNFLGDLKCRTLFSTHYHNLLNFFYKDPRITVGHMACLVENEDSENPTEENVTFLYKYAAGACPKSYGFHTAKLAATPTPIIQRAYNLARQFKSNAIKRKIAEHVAKYAFDRKVQTSSIQKLFSRVKTC